MRPTQTPIGLKLSKTARTVGRAFDEALADAGGSLPVWLVLLNLKIKPAAKQRELAQAIGISEATLTIQLNGMEAKGLVTRRRDPKNRRIHIVELTEAGNTLFLRQRNAASTFNDHLLTGLTQNEITTLSSLLDRLTTNANDTPTTLTAQRDVN